MSNQTERSNYFHLVMDIVWFGLAFTAILRFSSVYAIRLGATSFELGLLSALPGLFLLVGTALANWWRRHFRNSLTAIYVPTLGFRMIFLLPAMTPLFPPEWQVKWLIFAITLTAIPQGLAGTLFVVLMREAVNDRLLTRLWSRRLVFLNVALIVSTLGFGYLLNAASLHEGYVLMFLLAFLFALFSMLHVMRVRVLFPIPVPAPLPLRSSMRSYFTPNFMVVAFVILVTYLTFFAVYPLVNKHLVSGLDASEDFIAWFGVAELIAGALSAAVADRLMARFGARGLIALGMAGTAAAAAMIGLSPSLAFTLPAAFLTGFAWTLVGIAVFGFFLQRTPGDQMQQATVLFHEFIGLGQFTGSMIGGALAGGGMSLVTVLLLGAGLRLVASWLVIETRRHDHLLQVTPRAAAGD